MAASSAPGTFRLCCGGKKAVSNTRRGSPGAPRLAASCCPTAKHPLPLSPETEAACRILAAPSNGKDLRLKTPGLVTPVHQPTSLPAGRELAGITQPQHQPHGHEGGWRCPGWHPWTHPVCTMGSETKQPPSSYNSKLYRKITAPGPRADSHFDRKKLWEHLSRLLPTAVSEDGRAGSIWHYRSRSLILHQEHPNSGAAL